MGLGRGLEVAGYLLPSAHVHLGVCYKQQLQQYYHHKEQNETTGHETELCLQKCFLFIIHIKTTTSYLYYIENKVFEVKS